MVETIWKHSYVSRVLLKGGSTDIWGRSIESVEDALFLEFMYMYPGALVRHGEGTRMMHLLFHNLMSGEDFMFYRNERKRKWYKMQRHVGKGLAEERLSRNNLIVTTLINQEAMRRQKW